MTKTIVQYLIDAKERNPAWEAARHVKNGKWISISWPEYYSRTEKLGAGLIDLGVKKGDKVAIYSDTRLEWAISDMAILGVGAVTVPLYQSLTEDDIKYILNDSASSVLILENESLFKKFKTIAEQCPKVKYVIHIEPMSSTSENVMSLDEAMKLGEGLLAKEKNLFINSLKKVDIEDLATICYTSGTTGAPKGVMLAHRQIMSEVTDVFAVLKLTEQDRSLTFLPFAHILARVEHFGSLVAGFCAAYAENIDRLRSNMLDVRPTFLAGVPRIFEKIYNGVITQAEVSPAKAKIFRWAMGVGKKVSNARVYKKTLRPTTLIQYQIAKKLVFDKLNEKLGGRMRFAISGGAPLSREIAEFFHAANLLVLEGYGLTETTAAVTLNSPYDYAFGTVGKPLGDVEIKIAEDGEILVKSDKVMLGYHNRPDATEEVFTDGYFHTGDIGEFTSNGFLRITDRKKDLIKTAGGKYVAPQKIEGLLKLSKYISNVLIHGDNRKYIVALITLEFAEVERFARESGINFKNKQDLIQNPSIQKLIREQVSQTNTSLASFESVKNFAILENDFTIESGELTPSMKVKRKYCDTKYSDLLDSLYHG